MHLVRGRGSIVLREAGRRHNRLALLPASRVKGGAIVTDGCEMTEGISVGDFS